MARKPNATPPTDLANGTDLEDELPVVTDEVTPVAKASAAVRDESSLSVEEQLRAAEERAERAEREAAELRQRTGQQEADLFQTQRAVIERAIGETEREKADLRRQIVEAKQTGDYDKEVELLDQISQINNRLGQLNAGKNELDIRVEQMKDMPTDPVEAYVRNMKPEARAWVKAHPEVVTDPVANADLTAAHQRAVNRLKIEAGTPAYFQYLDEQMGYAQPADPEPERREIRRSNGNPPPAPVGRDNGSIPMDLPAGVSRRADGSYRLSADQLEAARISNMSPSAYLKSLLEIHRERNGRSLN